LPAFPGFPPEMPRFFKGLRANNNREWFQSNKEIFETKVKAPMIELVDQVNACLATFAPAYVTDPKKAIYRIYRDTRFSKDKTPYKDHIAASFAPAEGKGCAGALFFSASEESADIGGGFYMVEPETMLSIRSLLAGSHEEFRRLTGSKTFKTLLGPLRGEQLTRVPKGFAAGHPAEELLRHKQWYFYQSLDPAVATSSKLLGEIEKRFEVLAPLLDFMNAPLLALAKKQARAAKLLE